ncbi:storkhead-box protein 1 [Tupaia chinensis]|uniref:storkhead-box protein 1 n=1 Tax=Tupaia chinensis TaxID=246437 RepID=UPI0003C8E229|nr:storkhead-box protein 1 [Tupaia chinensis]
MSPIAQSQFVPLAEVLCCAISDMNAAQSAVTQESLSEYLMKHYPGIAIPSRDILYTTLGTLIKERKIYHTGEGYFIVTPQTYFITNATTQENKRVLSGEGCPVPTSVTYLVSVESCAESAQENAFPISHCQSCQCYPDVCTQEVPEPPAATELTGKSQKNLGDSKPWVQNQAASATQENSLCGSSTPSPCTRDREKGKKFGFSLLWRSISKKEKPKTQHSNFSAQFPPEEWPVRDEDNLENIPRDVEHEIIRRINPILTVDNLVKHTVLMQKYEKHKKYNSQGTSTDMLTARHRHSSKEAVKKRQGQSAKSRRQGHSHRDRRKARSQGSKQQPGSIRLERHCRPPATQPAPGAHSPSEAVIQKPVGENPAVLSSHLVYKKRISNPFQGLAHRGNPITKGHNVQKISNLKISQTGLKEKKPFQRSKSLDSSRILDGEASRPHVEHRDDKLKAEATYVDNATVTPVSAGFGDPLFTYHQCRESCKDGQCCSFREGTLRRDVCSGENEIIPGAFRENHSHFGKLEETKGTKHALPSPGTSSLDQTAACKLIEKTVHQLQNLGLLDYSVGADHLRQLEKQGRDSGEFMAKAFVQDAGTACLENGGFSDDDRVLCQNEVEDDGACSSLYLEDDDFSDDDDLCQMLSGHSQYSLVTGGSKWNHLEKQKVTERSLTEYSGKMDRFEPWTLKSNECYTPAGLLTNPGESQKPNLSLESCGLNSGKRFGFNFGEESSIAKCVQALVPAEGSLFDYCSTRKANSEAETLQDSVGDTGEKPAGWNQSPQNQEVRKHFTQKLELFSPSHMLVLAQDIQNVHTHLEGTENHSMAGDSGIDSPR